MFQAGAEDFITKPYHEGETLARIKRSLREYESHKSKQTHCGNLTLDRNTRQIFCNGKTIDAGSKAFDIIYLLAMNPGKVYNGRGKLPDRLDRQRRPRAAPGAAPGPRRPASPSKRRRS